MIPVPLKAFLTVLAASASVLGAVYLGLVLTFGQAWIDANKALVFTNGLYWLLIPPVFAVSIPKQKIGTSFHSPKIIKIIDNGLLIVEPCEWLGHGTGVSIYKVQEDVELFVFGAQVINIQSNKLVQLQPIVENAESFEISKLREIKEKLLIKPGRIT